MPSPNIFEMFTSSITSLQQSMHNLINHYTKIEVETSPYLSAIQSLNGRTPGEKYRDLNTIIRTLIESRNERGESAALTDDFRVLSPAMTPLVRAIVGVKLKMSELLVEALQSEDTSVLEKALSADWLFDDWTTNAVDFVKHVVPLVSLRARSKIIKKLARSLFNRPNDAEHFFRAFVEVYGIEQSLPLLIACTEPYIFEAILRHKIVLPVSVVNELYDKYPQLVVRYLQLGNKNNLDNEKERERHQICINDYDTFISKLIVKHTKDFVELFRLTPEKSIRLSARKAGLLLKYSKNVVIEEPQIFLKLIPLKFISKSLNKKDFEILYENLFPKDIEDFNLDEILDYIQFYTYGEKVKLVRDKLKKIYGKDLFDESNYLKSSRLLKMMSKEEKESRIKSILMKDEINSDVEDLYIAYLPPNESLPILKERIGKSSTAEERLHIIGNMILSCSIYNSKEDLLHVLQYYYDRHKNEQSMVLCGFFAHLKQEFDLKSLGSNHWELLKKIINFAYIKQELFKSHFNLIESVLEAALLVNYTNSAYLEKLVDMIVECKMEHRKSSSTWNVLKDKPELERKCIQKFFQLIPIKYPNNHTLWKEKIDRLIFVLSFIKTIDDYHKRNSCVKTKKRSKKSTSAQTIKIEDYPWIVKLIEEHFTKTDSETGFEKRKQILLKLVRKNYPEFYESRMNEFSTIRDIESGEALALLKRKPEKILANWPDYLAEAREKLHLGNRKERKAARRFVAATKWHHELPVKFVERCLIDIKDEGSILILGILLEGSAFEEVVAPYVPTDGKLDLDNSDAKESFELTRSILRAMRWTNPPVSFDFVATFCQGDYVALADATLASRTHRAPVSRVLDFGKRLVDKPVAVKKRGIRIIQRVATKAQLKEFLADMWATEMNWSLRDIVIDMVLEMFVGIPNEDNWELMKKCMEGITVNEKKTILKLAEVSKVNTTFLGRYVELYLNTIQKLSEKGLDFRTRTNSVCTIIQSLDEKLMRFVPEQVSLIILQRYFFDLDSIEISRMAQHFTVTTYLLSADSDRFEGRLKAVIEILTKVMDTFDTPHPKKRRFYPANYTIHEFFRDILQEMWNCNCNQSLEIIESLLRVFTSRLSPWQEPSSYLALNLFKEYLQSNTPEDFGIRCAKRCSDLVEEFSANEAVVNDIAKGLNDFIMYKIFKNVKHADLKLSIVQGLLKDDEFYGALISAKLLNYEDVNVYDERYDELINKLRQKQNESVQYNLYKYLNRIHYN